MSVKTISRAKGSSSAASAAYRSGDEVTNDRTGEVHDYTRKQGVEHSEIILPSGSPSWATNRSALWSAAELAEKRKDSTVGREFEVAIPKELTKKQGVALVREFTNELVDKHGFCADIAVHKDHKKKWDGSEKGFTSYHAHILCSTRRLTADGFKDKTRELDGMKTGRDHVNHWRERWETIANKHLEKAGHTQRIDRRSLKDQGIERDPTKHMGVSATAMERRGEKTEIGDANRAAQIEHQESKQAAANKEEIAAIKEQETALKDSIKTDEKEHAKQAQKSATPPKPELAKLPIDQQVAVFHLAREKMAEERRKKIERIAKKVQERLDRRTKAAEENRRKEPEKPTGLFASFKQSSHDKTQEAWKAAQRYADKLVVQGQSLFHRLATALHDRMAWSTGKIKEADPEIVKRIENHQRAERERLAEQRRAQEMQRRESEKNHERGGRGR